MALFSFIERWNLSPREQRLVRVLGVVAVVTAFIGAPLGVESVVASKRSENAEMRQTISDVQSARAQIREKQAKKDAIAARYRQKAPELGPLLEQSARKQKLDVTDNTDRPAVPIGKRYTERQTVIHLKKGGLLAISKFLEALEQSQLPLAITRLNLRRRMGEPDAYDVEIGVSAYDRTETPVAAAKPTASGSPSASGKAQ